MSYHIVYLNKDYMFMNNHGFSPPMGFGLSAAKRALLELLMLEGCH